MSRSFEGSSFDSGTNDLQTIKISDLVHSHVHESQQRDGTHHNFEFAHNRKPHSQQMTIEVPDY